ncbi:HAMP domain-containing sensor histidine kinase [Pseudoclavibacter sp. Z016]|uniref:sensor histidine kinase n=1 Tax=Pseudoclavibacter sp. Z016 TaxID=2080581 RepID=UPI000CE8182E|nr:HAMP domain-containing sensor histidine kinase [Pseudoclavibacter sp. Z016]PPF77771.1 sensor histidine kinase [Pseudoclavibacter sp. Z016]
MHRRLVLCAVPLLVLLLIMIAVPTAVTIADRHSAELTNDRLNDAARFSTAAYTAIGTDPVRLQAELDDYAELFDTPTWLLNRDGQIIHSAGLPYAVDDADLALVDAALSGQSPDITTTVWPWGPERLTIVAPVGRDSQVVGALVFDVPTETARATILTEWLILAAGLLVPGAVAFWLLWPMSRWILRPVQELERSVDAVARGDLDAKAGTDAGPSELRLLASTFNSMVGTVSATVTRQQEFVSDASHQLRTPLASTRISVENLEPYLRDDVEAREVHAEAIETIDRMTGTVAGLLDATQFQSRPPRIAAIGDALAGAAFRWAEAGARAGIAVQTVHLQGETLEVQEPAGGLDAVVSELVTNAIKLSGGTEVRVAGRPDIGSRSYVVTVDDNGIGLASDDREHATQRFWRSPRTSNLPGTGLGLSIVAQALRDIGGGLTLADAPGGGLRVEAAVPLAESQS